MMDVLSTLLQVCFTSIFGRILTLFKDALAPGTAPNHRSMDPSKGAENNSRGMDLAHDNLGTFLVTSYSQQINNVWLGIPYVIDPQDLANPKVDEQSVMTYISWFRNAQPVKRML